MALSFDGSTNVIDMGHNSPLVVAANAPMAVSCWVQFTTITPGAQEQITAGGFASGSTSYGMAVDTNPNFTWGSYDGTFHGNAVNLGTLGITVGPWFQFYGDFDGTNLWRLFKGGVSVSSVTDSIGPRNPGRNFTIGCVDAGGTYVQFFPGCIADVAVFNGVLTPTEITNLGNGTLRPNVSMSQTLLGYWKLDTVGSNQTDFSTFGNTGVYTQTTPSLCGTSPPYGGAGAVTNYAAGQAGGPGMIKRVRMIGT